MQLKRSLLSVPLALLLAASGTVGAAAQRADICERLEAQLAEIEFGRSGPSAADVRRYERAMAEEARALDAARMQYSQSGCRRMGFLFFQPSRPAACEALEGHIRRLEATVHHLHLEREREVAGRRGGEPLRRQIMAALSHNGCRGHYAQDRDDSVFGMLYGETTRDPFGYGYGGGTYRTLCVRSCDGFFWPVSFSTAPGQFEADAHTCRSSCPGADVSLYVHHNPGEDLDQAVSLSGAPYTALPNAFRYRKEYDGSCACRSASQVAARVEAATGSAALSGNGPVSLVAADGANDAATIRAPQNNTLAQAPLPRPRPGTEKAAAPPTSQRAVNQSETTDDAAVPLSRDGRPVRIVGPGFTYYRADDG